jgi:hypothetical protein
LQLKHGRSSIISYELADLQYSEIAPGMLVRQPAQALIEARNSAPHEPAPPFAHFCRQLTLPFLLTAIVEGAVTIVTSAVTKLGENGIHLNDNQQSR